MLGDRVLLGGSCLLPGGDGWVSYAERMGVTTQGRHQTGRDLKSWDVPLEGGRWNTPLLLLLSPMAQKSRNPGNFCSWNREEK